MTTKLDIASSGPAGTAAAASRSAELLPAGFLALGTFAIGTEGFMIAPLLPTMAADFRMTVPQMASLIVVFTLTLAVSSPIMTVLTARWNRRAALQLATARQSTDLDPYLDGYGVYMVAKEQGAEDLPKIAARDREAAEAAKAALAALAEAYPSARRPKTLPDAGPVLGKATAAKLRLQRLD